MAGNEIQIISRLFEFLSAYQPQELAQAASSPLITQNVREALLALARARAENTSTSEPVRASANGTDGRHLRLLETQFIEALKDPHVVPSNSQLLNLLLEEGFRVRATAKDSRSRIIGQARRSLDTFPPSRREQVIKDVLRRLKPNQTEGWFKVIRGE